MSQIVVVRIRGYQFSISAPYAEGQKMGEAEVQQLNDLRADNIRNNLTKPVLDALATLPPEGMLSPDQLAELQEKITAYDKNYSLQLKHQARPRVGQIEAEARVIAEERLDAQLRSSGLLPEAVDYPAMLAEFIALDTVQALARERVAAKRQVVSTNLADLL